MTELGCSENVNLSDSAETIRNLPAEERPPASDSVKDSVEASPSSESPRAKPTEHHSGGMGGEEGIKDPVDDDLEGLEEEDLKILEELRYARGILIVDSGHPVLHW